MKEVVVIFDTATGNPLRVARVPQGEASRQAGVGEVAVAKRPNMDNLSEWKWVDGKPVKAGAPLQNNEPTYAELRAAAYPSITEQLDMLFHDPDQWRAMIAAIKEAYPKPATSTQGECHATPENSE